MIVIREDDEHLWLFCPNHEDKNNPNLCVNKVDGKYSKGFGFCFACGYTTQFSKEVVDKMSKTPSICREKKPINWFNLNSEYIKNEFKEKTSNRLASRWKVNSLIYYHVGYDGKAITFPMFNEDSKIIGIHRRFADGTKSCVNGSQLGLFLPSCGGLNIIISEGISDASVATHLGYYGIGKPCAGFGEQLVRKYLENTKYQGEVIIVQDNDVAGLKSRIKLEKELSDFKLKVVVPDTDLKDYYLKNGFDQTVSLLEN